MKISKELLKGSTAIMILKVIAEEDSYGYRITQTLSERSGELFKLNEGTLYPILHTLEKEGIIESYRKETESGRERKYYRITTEGRAYLLAKTAEWRTFSEAVSRVLEEK